MADDSLLSFVSQAKDRGVPDDSLVGILRQSGWSERRIYRALSDYYTSALGVAVPIKAQSSGAARDAFFYLLNFITLGFWTVALWQIWDDLVRRWFPDPLAYQSPSLREDIAWQVAVIVVAFPIFAFVHATIARELARRPDLYYSPIRRWLTYLALVIAAHHDSLRRRGYDSKLDRRSSDDAFLARHARPYGDRRRHLCLLLAYDGTPEAVKHRPANASGRASDEFDR